ncbi:MAG: epoxyqueuosine reductase QueH, partial [Salinisphaera sp.]|nr:epoxyqueuosine reductase QueH [Salinisphaera sp.]
SAAGSGRLMEAAAAAIAAGDGAGTMKGGSCNMNPYSKATYQRPVLETPGDARRLLLHSCCAPCAGEVMEAARASRIDFTVYFYNPMS